MPETETKNSEKMQRITEIVSAFSAIRMHLRDCHYDEMLNALEEAAHLVIEPTGVPLEAVNFRLSAVRDHLMDVGHKLYANRVSDLALLIQKHAKAVA